MLVPRHPQRFGEVVKLVRKAGLGLQRRSSNDPVLADTRVWLGDSMGEMFAYYHASDVALIGGSWLPLGGQNLIEACAVGCPVVVGPHTFNFSAAAEQAIEAGAAVRASDMDDGIGVALQILQDPARRSAMGAAENRVAKKMMKAIRPTATPPMAARTERRLVADMAFPRIIVSGNETPFHEPPQPGRLAGEGDFLWWVSKFGVDGADWGRLC